MRVRLIRPGNMAQAIASHLPTLQKFASEVVRRYGRPQP